MRNPRYYVPTLTAAVVAVNGFVNLVAGLAEVFQLQSHIRLDRGSLSYLDVTPGLHHSGFVWAFLGVVQIFLGKGLLERRRRAWWSTLGVLGLLLLNNVPADASVRTTAVPLVLAAALIAVRGQFSLHPDHRRFSYAEIVTASSVLFALAFGIGGSYLLRHELNAIHTWTDAVYFTVVTYSTLGYGDILPVTENARLFTILMVAIGLSSFVTALTVVVGPLIEERMKGVVSVMSKFQRDREPRRHLRLQRRHREHHGRAGGARRPVPHRRGPRGRGPRAQEPRLRRADGRSDRDPYPAAGQPAPGGGGYRRHRLRRQQHPDRDHPPRPAPGNRRTTTSASSCVSSTKRTSPR